MNTIANDPATQRQIAETIVSQIGRNNMMCLGATNRTFMSETENVLGGLSFKFTNCFKIKSGTVLVFLMPSDTYTVKIYNRLGNIQWDIDDVYCDGLADVLQDKIGY
jgi:hypothetical protein